MGNIVPPVWDCIIIYNKDTAICFQWSTHVCVLSRFRLPLPAFWHRGQFRWISRAQSHQGSIQAEPTGNTLKHSYTHFALKVQNHKIPYAESAEWVQIVFTTWLNVEHFPADEAASSLGGIDHLGFSHLVLFLGLCGQASGRGCLQHQQHCHQHAGC